MADRTDPSAVAAELDAAAPPRDWETEIVSGPPVPTDPDWVVERKQAYLDQVAQAGQAEEARVQGIAQVELGHSIAEDVERDLAERAHRAGVDLTLASSNVDLDDRPHFALFTDGREVCGQDLEPWPCTTWRTVVGPRLAASGVAGATMTSSAAEEQRVAEAAKLLGVDPGALAAFRAQQAEGTRR